MMEETSPSTEQEQENEGGKGYLHSPLTRFSAKVDQYIKYRPSYPAQAVLSFLVKTISFTTSQIVADIGAGTGLFTKILVSNGNRVYAIEPNKEMREACESLVGAEHTNMAPIDGTAEETTLGACSVDVICCAQAFHWFDPAKTKKEWLRILKPNGWVVLLWNSREGGGLNESYEAAIRAHCPEYKDIQATSVATKTSKRQQEFFGENPIHELRVPNPQQMDLEGLLGRVESASYAPLPGTTQHRTLLKDLIDAFTKHEVDGHVTMGYTTVVQCAQLK
eukprot:TRINITY_DN54906_c0_g1_i1.p2 TRINITY_DN54906_c0_g1~~TRINITY_DN54906_c0_g1_i1.p2  ORF type:complete len:297 (+),score=16.54 TRINITY_DN54906_c0_g1_i1:60-893(+)